MTTPIGSTWLGECRLLSIRIVSAPQEKPRRKPRRRKPRPITLDVAELNRMSPKKRQVEAARRRLQLRGYGWAA